MLQRADAPKSGLSSIGNGLGIAQSNFLHSSAYCATVRRLQREEQAMTKNFIDMSHPVEAQPTPVSTLLVVCGGRAPYWVANAFAGAPER
jgi:hypothetical protein